MTKTMSLFAALRDYFGMLPGQTLPEFLTECRALAPEDKDYFRWHLASVGYTVTTNP